MALRDRDHEQAFHSTDKETGLARGPREGTGQWAEQGWGPLPATSRPTLGGQDAPCHGWAPAGPRVCLLTLASLPAGKPALKHTGQLCPMLWAVQGWSWAPRALRAMGAKAKPLLWPAHCSMTRDAGHRAPIHPALACHDSRGQHLQPRASSPLLSGAIPSGSTGCHVHPHTRMGHNHAARTIVCGHTCPL